MNVLSVLDLAKNQGQHQVLKRIDFLVQSGQIFGLLGPNGAGKTTTIQAIMGLVRPARGRVLLDGRDITGLPMYQRARLGICYLPQEPSIFVNLTVEENILAVLKALKLGKPQALKRLEQLLSDMGLQSVRRQPSKTLSGGERRRVEIARLLATSPKFLLLDEPFAGLDPLAIIDLQAAILAMAKNQVGVIISDHNVRDTLSMCTMATIIKAGSILAEGTPTSLAASPEALAGYLGREFTL